MKFLYREVFVEENHVERSLVVWIVFKIGLVQIRDEMSVIMRLLRPVFVDLELFCMSVFYM